MDPIKFDDLTRSLFVLGSRRQMLAVAGAGIASLLAQAAERAGAKRKKNKKNKNNKKNKKKKKDDKPKCAPTIETPCGNGCCDVLSQTCCGGKCCPIDRCISNSQCCPSGRRKCGGQCCDQGASCCNGSCCSTACVDDGNGGEMCCPPEQVCGGVCCRLGTTCCENRTGGEPMCCLANETCHPGQDGKRSVCCDAAFPVPCANALDVTCCLPGATCIRSDNTAPPQCCGTEWACGDQCCETDEICHPGTGGDAPICCAAGRVPCGKGADRFCCQPGGSCAINTDPSKAPQCCAPGLETCDGECCPENHFCCGDKTCCPKSRPVCVVDGTGDVAPFCCPEEEIPTIGKSKRDNMPRAACCDPKELAGLVGPCDGVCCATNPSVSMCCPGCSNPCRAIVAGCDTC